MRTIEPSFRCLASMIRHKEITSTRIPRTSFCEFKRKPQDVMRRGEHRNVRHNKALVMNKNVVRLSYVAGGITRRQQRNIFWILTTPWWREYSLFCSGNNTHRNAGTMFCIKMIKIVTDWETMSHFIIINWSCTPCPVLFPSHAPFDIACHSGWGIAEEEADCN